MVPEPKPEP